MFCRDCGTELGKKVKACPNCGEKPLVGTKYCQGCGAKTKSDQEYCKNCGKQLIKQGASPQDDIPFITKAVSFAMPIIGFIIFMFWRGKKPEAARKVCNCTILGLVFGMILYIMGIVMGASSYLGY